MSAPGPAGRGRAFGLVFAFVLQNQMKNGFVWSWALPGGPGEIAIYGY